MSISTHATVLLFSVLLVCVLCKANQDGQNHDSDNRLINAASLALASKNKVVNKEDNLVSINSKRILSFNNIDVIYNTFIDVMKAFVPQLTGNLDNLLDIFIKGVKQIVKSLNVEVEDSKHKIIHISFDRLKKILFKVKNELINLMEHFEDHLLNTIMHFNETLVNHTDNIDAWSLDMKQKLRTFNNSNLYSQACKYIDNIILEKITQLQNCCKITINPMRSLCLNIRSIFSESLNVLVDLMDHMQTCLEDKISYMEYMLPCINIALNDISELINRTIEYRYKISGTFPIKLLYSKYCISLILVEVEDHKRNIEEKIYQ